MKKIRNQINGVLLLDKPLGLSSNSAIQRVKYLLNAEKVGHTGTLDPLATGLLPVCLGEATKFASYLLDGDKEYIATAQLGVVTDSGDAEGNIVATNIVNTSLALIEQAINKFRGAITQIPPMYSALKHNGRPLYEYARAGITIERPSRNVIIHELELLNYNPELQQIMFRARVSKGTYIRTLAEDIGNALGCGASLVQLRRTHSNLFSIDNAYAIDDLLQVENWQELHILPVDILCQDLAKFTIDDKLLPAISNGNKCKLVNMQQDDPLINQSVRVYHQDKFMGIAELQLHHGIVELCPKRMMKVAII